MCLFGDNLKNVICFVACSLDFVHRVYLRNIVVRGHCKSVAGQAHDQAAVVRQHNGTTCTFSDLNDAVTSVELSILVPLYLVILQAWFECISAQM